MIRKEYPFLNSILNFIHWKTISFYKDINIESFQVSRKSVFNGANTVRFGSKVSSSSVIGYGTYISGPSTIIHNCIIGRYCSIASGVSIGLENHDIYKFSTHPIVNNLKGYQNNLKKGKTIIGNDVWIAAGSVILEGVKIGDGAVVGANSTVIKDIPPYAVVVGSPSKIIKYRFNKEIIEKIYKYKWWNLDYKDLIKNIDRFDKK